MKIFTTTASVIALTALTAPVATASTVLIDNFSVSQEVRDVADTGFSNTNDVTIPVDVKRTFTVETFPEQAPNANDNSLLEDVIDGSILKTQGGQLKLSNSLTSDGQSQIGQFAVASVAYDYSSAPGGSIDLVNGGNSKFSFNGISGDLLGSAFKTTVTSGTGGDAVTESFTEVLDLNFNQFTPFSNFGAVNFNDVTSLIFEFDTRSSSPGFDGTLGSITAVPLPASALLLLGGVGGFAGLSAANRRRRRKEV